MKSLLACLLACSVAQAAPLPADAIANMVAQSEAVMRTGVCAVANDGKVYTTQAIVLLLPAPIGARRILRSDYEWIRSAGYAKGASGRFVMSERIEKACQADAFGSRCLAARSLWSQKPLR